jgi:iron complex transport system substrate-binding protein
MMVGVKILSLLPSATEIVYALGLGDSLVGRSFECDHPAAACAKPVVSSSTLPAGLETPRDIDDAVMAATATGAPIYRLDTELIGRLRPDVVITQDLCAVCAVPTGDVEAALDVLGCRADVVSLDPLTLDDVFSSIETVGAATGTERRALSLVDGLRARVDEVRQRVSGLDRPRALALEWADPPFSAGHWVPEMIDAAGANEVLGRPGVRSRRVEWVDVQTATPSTVVFMPCGYHLPGAIAQGRDLLRMPALAGVDTLHAVDADGCFSRPGPRVVDGIEALADAFHPDVVHDPRPEILATLERTPR